MIAEALAVGIILLLAARNLESIRKQKEAFAASEAAGAVRAWVSDNPMLIPLDIKADRIRKIDATQWPSLLSKAPFLPGYGPATLVVDPQDARASYSRLPGRPLPKGYFVAMASLKDAFEMECGFQWVGKTLGYTDRSSLLFLLSILHGYRISLKTVRLVYVPPKLWLSFDKMLGRTLDVVVTYFVPDTPYHRLIIRQNVSVMGFRRLSAPRLRLALPDAIMEDASLEQLIEGGIAQVLARERSTRLPAMQLVAVDVNDPIEYFTGDAGDGESAAEARDKDAYRCYGDPKLLTRAACESPYDVSGMRKPHPTVWDRPCKKDDDCPFLTSAGGGCDVATGKCEMPLGVQRRSFRQYNAEPPFQPFCHDTSDPWDFNACEPEDNHDWVFANKNDAGGIDLRPTADRILADAAAPTTPPTPPTPANPPNPTALST